MSCAVCRDFNMHCNRVSALERFCAELLVQSGKQRGIILTPRVLFFVLPEALADIISSQPIDEIADSAGPVIERPHSRQSVSWHTGQTKRPHRDKRGQQEVCAATLDQLDRVEGIAIPFWVGRPR